MDYITVKEASEKWGISKRRVQVLCVQNRIDGAEKLGTVWIIPKYAKKPDDKRKKSEHI
ncbi:MAG: helix-turn-helix domain-containing protein [Caloramator sp.]|nr:helix-turn-helix domain-containing protein [Caloramator sp.]